jgi:FtsH-binding integral membrane protein
MLVCVHGVSETMLTTLMPAFASKFMSAAAHWEVRFMVNGLLMGLQLLEAHVFVKFFISNNADAWLIC